MTKPYFLFLISTSFLLLGSCESSSDDVETDLKEERDPRFAHCYYDEDLAKNKCDSVLIAFFGAQGYVHLKLNKELSFIGCDENSDLTKLEFGDDNCCLPRTYDLIYDMIYKGDTVCQIPLFAGPEMKFAFTSEEEKKKLLPYKALLRGDLAFDYADLISEMKRKDMNPELYEIELIEDTLRPNLANTLYWELTFFDENDDMMYNRVDAQSGGLFPMFRPVTRMGD